MDRTDIDFGFNVDKYLRLREAIKKKDDEHKEAMRPARDMLEQLETMLLGHLNQINTDNVKIKGVGTVYKVTKKSATIADKEALRRFVESDPTHNLDLLDFKANAVRVAEWISEHDGELPPGVNYATHAEVNVRKA